MAWRGNRLQKVARLARTFAADPVVVSRALPGEMRQWYQLHRRGEDPGFAADEAWDEHMHELLGAAWPCPRDARLGEVLADVGAVLGSRGWGFGRDTYGWYADGDSSLCSAVWCVALHTHPEVVIETGVAHGVTSRIVLEALAQNHRGTCGASIYRSPSTTAFTGRRALSSRMRAGLAGRTWRARASSDCRH